MIDKIIIDEEYYKENNEKMYIDFYSTGGTRNLEYKNKYNSNLIGRANGPASIYFFRTGDIHIVKWVDHENGMHKIDGPAFIEYNIDGEIKQIEWYYKRRIYTSRIIRWINENNFNSYKEMAQDDFNRMWFEII